MTVSTTNTRVSYMGDGTANPLTVTFEFFDEAELKVIERVIATGAETTKTLTTHYTVSGGNGSTGTVTPVAVVPVTVEWHIRRKTALTQGSNYQDNDELPTEQLESDFDRAALRDQEVNESRDRTLRFPKTDAASLTGILPSSVERASKYAAFDASGNAIATAGPTGDSSTPVSTFVGDNVFPAIDAAAVRSAIEVNTATTSAEGLVELATDAEYIAGTAADRAVTPANIASDRLEEKYIDHTRFTPTTTNGASVFSAETVTFQNMIVGLAFDQTTDQFAQAFWAPPKYWNAGQIKVRFFWTARSGSGAVRWRAQGRAYSNSDAIDQEFSGTETADTLLTADDMHMTNYTSAFTLNGSPQKGDIVIIEVERDATDANDTLNADAILMGIQIQYTRDAVDAT